MQAIEVSFLIETTETGDQVFQVTARMAKKGMMFGPPNLLHDSHSAESAQRALRRAVTAAINERTDALTVF